MTVVTGSLRALQSQAQSILAPFKRKSAALHLGPSFGEDRIPKRNFVMGFAACLLVLCLTAPLSAQKPLSSEREQVGHGLVHHGDVIDVDVLGGFEFDWRGTITPEGNLDGLVTLDEPVYALCRTEKEIALDVAKAYSKVLRDPKVEVRIIDRSNRALARVDGAVRTPTRFSIRREVSLRELIVLAGGFISGASGAINIIRPANLGCNQPGNYPGADRDNRSTTLNIKISELLSGKALFNPVILSGDIVTVSRADTLYVIGAVNNPGAIFATAGLTVTRAIATAGGMTKEAGGDTVSIFRRTGTETKMIELDVSRIKRGEVEDIPLQSFDILDVPTKGGGKRSFPPAAPAVAAHDVNWAQMPLKIVD